MRLFFAYVRLRRGALALFVLLLCLSAAVFFLYGLPGQAVGYGALLCLFAGAVYCAADLFRFARRHRALEEMRGRISLPDAPLPPPDDLLERDYQELIGLLRSDAARAAAQSDRRFADMMEYYTLWTHEIKTPLAAMELMLQKDAPDPAALREQLFRVEQYADMALGYLRLDSTSTDLILKAYPLDDIVRQAVKRYAAQFIRRRIALDYAPAEASVLTDEKWLLFVIEQVLSNALKYTPKGTVYIYMEPDKTLVIRDTGVGIRPEDLPRVFEKGYTGLNGRADKRSTGIGLYLCRRVCDMLGHTISIGSAPGEGTTVRIGLADRRLETE